MGTVNQRYYARKRGEATYRLVRYADDFVICVAGNREHAEALVTETARVLRPIGLTLSEEKTRITHIDEGFDFLGWRISATWDVETARASSCSRPSRRSRRSRRRSRRSPAAAPTSRSTSSCTGSTRCCGAGASTSAPDNRRGPSNTCASTPGGELSDGCDASTRGGTGAGCVATTFPAGGRPAGRRCSTTRPRSAPPATATGPPASRLPGRAAGSPRAMRPPTSSNCNSCSKTTTGTPVESRMRGNSHVRFGGRRRADHHGQPRHRRLAADPTLRLSARRASTTPTGRRSATATKTGR
jgi:hypothetical protein